MLRDDAWLDPRPKPRAELPDHLASLDLDIAGAWEAERQPGEVFLWMGRPDRVRAIVRAGGSAGLAVGCTLAALAILASHLAARPVPPLGPDFVFLVGFFALCGGIGCWSTASAARRASQTVYALSDRRALVREPSGASGFVVRSYGPGHLAALTASPHRHGGAGTDLVFESFRALPRFGVAFDHRRGFLDIDDAPKVLDLIRANLLASDPPSERARPIPSRSAPTGRSAAMTDAVATFEDAGPDGDLAEHDPAVDLWIDQELTPDEKLLWVGRPRPLPVLGSQGRSAFQVLVLVGAWILVAGPLGGIAAPIGWWGLLLGWIFVLSTIVQLVRSFRAVRDQNRAIYFLTSRRAVVLTPGRGGPRDAESFGPGAMGGLVRKERADGSGDLLFEEFGPAPRGVARPIRPRGFLNVDRVRDVERLVRSTLLADAVVA